MKYRCFRPWVLAGLACLGFIECRKYQAQMTLPKGVIYIPLVRVNNHTAYAAQFRLGKPRQNITAVVDTSHPGMSFQSIDNPECRQGWCQEFGAYDNRTSKTAGYSGSGFNDTLGGQGSGSFARDTLCIGQHYHPCMKKAQFGTIETFFQNFTGQRVSRVGLGGFCTEKDCTSYPSLVNQLYDQGLIKKRVFSLYVGQGSSDGYPGHLIFGGFDKSKSKSIYPSVKRPMVGPALANQSGPTNRIRLKGIHLRPLLDEYIHLKHKYPNGGAEILLDTGSHRWSMPWRLVQQLMKWWSIPPNTNLSQRVPVHCWRRRTELNKYALLDFGPSKRAVGQKMKVFPANMIVNIGPKKCVLDLVPSETGGVWGTAFLRMVYVIFDYDNNTMTMMTVRPYPKGPPQIVTL